MTDRETSLTEAMIFNVDGTLVASVGLHARAWQDVFRDFDYDVGFDLIRSQTAKGGDQLVPVFLSEGELAEQVMAFPKARALFERLRVNGKCIALASSAKQDEPAKFKEILGTSDLIDTETSSDGAENSKPHEDSLREARCVTIYKNPVDLLENCGQVRSCAI